MKAIRGILVDVHEKRARIFTILDDLKYFYSTLQCKTIEIPTKKIGDRPYSIVCDEEGFYTCEPIFTWIGKGDGIVGSIFVCNRSGEELSSLTDEDIEYIRRHSTMSLSGCPVLVESISDGA